MKNNIKISVLMLLLLGLNAIATPFLLPVITDKYEYTLSKLFLVIYIFSFLLIVIFLIYNIISIIKTIKNKTNTVINSFILIILLFTAILYDYSTESKGFEDDKYYFIVKKDTISFKIFCSEQVYELIDTDTEYYIHTNIFDGEHYLKSIQKKGAPQDNILKMTT